MRKTASVKMKKNHAMMYWFGIILKKSIKIAFSFLFIVSLFLLGYPIPHALGDKGRTNVEFPSSFNPVGSGARAIGRGGAFIAVADDATAASWNPAGLIQLKRKPELSLVLSGFHREENNDFRIHPESSGSNCVLNGNINYISLAGSFELFNRNMSVALTYQHLYDFNREWHFPFIVDNDRESYKDEWNYQQKGSLSALGLSYCIQIIPQLSVGFTLNFWKDWLNNNNWKESYHWNRSGVSYNKPFSGSFSTTEEYSFSGFNFNTGLLYRINKRLTVGAVFKSPFKADIEHKREEYWDVNYPTSPSNNDIGFQDEIRHEEIDMPLSYGIGFNYNFSDKLSLSADFYRTEWDNFIYRGEDKKETSPINRLPINESDVVPTHQVRIGFEYLYINPIKRYVIPLRGGLFYDPAPAEGSPDNFYGFSIGSGFTKIDWFSFDITYQFRFGDEVGKSSLQHLGFSQNVYEHMLYISMILYRF